MIFLWTPPHFWALVLFKQDEYRRAGIPMMPVVHGETATKWQSFGYTVLLLVASLWLVSTGTVGWVFGGIALTSGLVFMGLHIPLMREKAPQVQGAKRTFRFSLLYLALVYGGMVVNFTDKIWPHLSKGGDKLWALPDPERPLIPLRWEPS